MLSVAIYLKKINKSNASDHSESDLQLIGNGVTVKILSSLWEFLGSTPWETVAAAHVLVIHPGDLIELLTPSLAHLDPCGHFAGK